VFVKKEGERVTSRFGLFLSSNTVNLEKLDNSSPIVPDKVVVGRRLKNRNNEKRM